MRAAQRVVHDAGRFDVLVANLASTAPGTVAVDVDDAEWRDVFAALVDLLPGLIGAAGKPMIERRDGKYRGSAARRRCAA